MTRPAANAPFIAPPAKSVADPGGWIAERTRTFDASGIRRVFDLAASLSDPINLSIGQPDFDVPEPVAEAAIEAIRGGKNAYSPTQGIAPLRVAFQTRIAEQYPGHDREAFISSGTSGGLVLTMLSLVNPGDEVIFLDPYFLMYPALIRLCGGVPVTVDSYPDFRLDPAKIEAAITPRTKMILVNSPANPTGAVADPEDLKAVAQIAADRGIALVSDEIYREFFYDGTFTSPASFNDQTIVIDGFSKSHAMTGWRVGVVHGPPAVIATMLKIQQYSFVCSPQPMQWGALRAMEVSVADHMADYRRKRDLIVRGLGDRYDLATPGGAFYAFPAVPQSADGGKTSGGAFVEKAIANNLLIIPGSIFFGSRHAFSHLFCRQRRDACPRNRSAPAASPLTDWLLFRALSRGTKGGIATKVTGRRRVSRGASAPGVAAARPPLPASGSRRNPEG